MANSFIKDQSKIWLLNWYWSVVKKDINGGICHSINRYAKAHKNSTKKYDKNRELSYLHYCDVNCLYGWAMLQKLQVNTFEWIKSTSQFNEGFIKTYLKYFMEVDVQ